MKQTVGVVPEQLCAGERDGFRGVCGIGDRSHPVAFEGSRISKINTGKNRTSIQRGAVMPNLERSGGPAMLHLTAYGLAYLFIRSLPKHSWAFPLPAFTPGNRDTKMSQIAPSFKMHLHNAKCLHAN